MKVSAIVPVYNEEKKVSGVLEILKSCPYLDEVICVNDGSTDGTLSKIKNIKGISIVSYKQNKGKAFAVVRGIKKAKSDIVVFIDGDLEGLSDKNIKEIISYLTSGKYVAAIGYYSFHQIDDLFRPLSGQRAYYRKDLVKHLNTLKTAGYGLELQLNYLFKDQKIKVFELKGVRHYIKYQKQPYDTVARLMLRESKDLLVQILKQEDPVDYFTKSYFSQFYFPKTYIFKNQMTKLIESIKKIQKEVI